MWYSYRAVIRIVNSVKKMMQPLLFLLISFSGDTYEIQIKQCSNEKNSKLFIDFESCLPIWMRAHFGEVLVLKSLQVLLQWSLNIPCM